MVQMSNTPLNLRFKFKKVGNLQYISHLDLVRTMNKIIVRAKLPLWYTEGFNPKPKMVFAAPLSVGTESVTEFVDIRLSERIDPELALKLINQNMTDEMQALACYYPERKLTELKWLSYSIAITTENASENIASACEAALTSDTVFVDKKTKNGDMKTVDIRPLIKSASAVFSDGVIRISCVLSADQSCFLNPEYIIDVLKKECGVLCSEDLLMEHYTIMRERAYLADMTEFS